VEIDQGELDAGVDLRRILADAEVRRDLDNPWAIRAQIGGWRTAQAGSDIRLH
jgi:hypothetical protein